MLALEWTDLDGDRATLEVSSRSKKRRAGSPHQVDEERREPRRFSIPAKVLEILREHKRDQDEHHALYGATYASKNLIFARPDGEYYSPDKVGTRVRAAMRSAGLAGVSLHSLRHSHASELLSQGAPITAVAERLGHASANVTLGIYAPAAFDNAAAAKLWNDAMADVLEAGKEAVCAEAWEVSKC